MWWARACAILQKSWRQVRLKLPSPRKRLHLKFPNAKDGYVKDDFNFRLPVTKSLGTWFIPHCYLFIYLFLFLKPCPAGWEGSIHRAGVFPQLFPQRARWGFFILWMLLASLPGLVLLYLFHRLFLVCPFVIVELAYSINARPPVSTR